MKTFFGALPSGEETYLYTITGGGLTAVVTDLGATLVKLLVPDADGNMADVVLGYDNSDDYVSNPCFLAPPWAAAPTASAVLPLN